MQPSQTTSASSSVLNMHKFLIILEGVSKYINSYETSQYSYWNCNENKWVIMNINNIHPVFQVKHLLFGNEPIQPPRELRIPTSVQQMPCVTITMLLWENMMLLLWTNQSREHL